MTARRLPRVLGILGLILLSILLTGPLYGASSFDSLDLGTGTSLVFRSRTDAPGYGTYDTGFLADYESKAITQLSFFPESATYLPLTQEIQIENRYGMYRSAWPFTKVTSVGRFPSFASGGEIMAGKISLSSPSPNGAWILYQRPSSPAYAELVLLNLKSGEERLISNKSEYGVDGPPALWNPESDLLVYEKGSDLYYFSLSQATNGRVLDESFRKLGPGRINSLRWGSNRQLYYLSGSIVYEILNAELFTRSLYQDFLRIGRVIGRLPHDYDPAFDTYSMSPDGRILLLAKNRLTYYLYPMNEETHPDGLAWRLPFLSVPRSANFTQALWSPDGMISLVFESKNQKGELRSLLYRVDTTQAEPSFTLVESPWIRGIASAGSNALVMLANSVLLVDQRTWKTLKTWEHPEPLYGFPISDTRLVILGAQYAEMIKLDTNTRDFLFFTQSSKLGFDRETGLVSQESGGKAYSLNNDVWLARSPLALRSATTANDKVRVYAESLHSGPYRNMIMFRKVQEVGTFSLFPSPRTAYEAFPTTDEPQETYYIRNGSRIRSRAVALSFNAVDSAEGLEDILATLRNFGVKASFFINGDFMRKYPAAVRKIVAEGHENANLFYTWFNFTDQRYKIDTNFIKLGLARNEDEFREVSGSELSLLWRSPNNLVNKQVLDASRDLRYTLVGSDVDALEYESRRTQNGSLVYTDAAQIVEKILTEKKPGSIITLGTGISADANGRTVRDAYTFQKLDVLIHNLMIRGYDIVTVSRLIEAAR